MDKDRNKDPYRPKVLEVFDQVRDMTSEERLAIAARAGIITEDGELTKKYGGIAEPTKVKPSKEYIEAGDKLLKAIMAWAARRALNNNGVITPDAELIKAIKDTLDAYSSSR